MTLNLATFHTRRDNVRAQAKSLRTQALDIFDLMRERSEMGNSVMCYEIRRDLERTREIIDSTLNAHPKEENNGKAT